MYGRQRDNARTELKVMVTLMGTEKAWLRAQEVASWVNLPWRQVAFALRRLAKRGYVEQRVVSYRGKHRSQEYTTEYRFLQTETPGETFRERYFNWIRL